MSISTKSHCRRRADGPRYNIVAIETVGAGPKVFDENRGGLGVRGYVAMSAANPVSDVVISWSSGLWNSTSAKVFCTPTWLT